MILPDVNVLVHGLLWDTDDNGLCRKWLDGVVNREDRYGISAQALSEFIRVATHPRVFPNRVVGRGRWMLRIVDGAASLLSYSTAIRALVHFFPSLPGGIYIDARATWSSMPGMLLWQSNQSASRSL